MLSETPRTRRGSALPRMTRCAAHARAPGARIRGAAYGRIRNFSRSRALRSVSACERIVVNFVDRERDLDEWQLCDITGGEGRPFETRALTCVDDDTLSVVVDVNDVDRK